MNSQKPILFLGDANADLLIQLSPSDSIQAKNMEILSAGSVAADPEQVVLRFGGVIGSTACTAALQGCPSLFLGHGGNDFFGRQIKAHLEQCGVNTKYYTLLDDAPSLLVLCLISPDGERDFRPYPYNGSAPSRLSPEDVPSTLSNDISLLFTSGVQLTEEPVCSAVFAAMHRCKEAGIPIAFDINLRTNTFGWDETMKRRFSQALELADIIFGSAKEELPQVTETHTAEDAAASLLRKGEKILVAKDGSRGSRVYTGNRIYSIGPFPVPVVDTVGAGDTFNGGFLSAVREGRSPSEALLWGSATAAYTLSFAGAEHQPSRDDIIQIIKQYPQVHVTTKEV